jgi:hypothetical protein
MLHQCGIRIESSSGALANASLDASVDELFWRDSLSLGERESKPGHTFDGMKTTAD